MVVLFFFFFFQAEDGIRDLTVTGVQTCALPIWRPRPGGAEGALRVRPEGVARADGDPRGGAGEARQEAAGAGGSERYDRREFVDAKQPPELAQVIQTGSAPRRQTYRGVALLHTVHPHDALPGEAAGC